VEKADKLLKLQISLGDEQRQIIAGIAQYYDPETLPGKKIVVVANLAPATIRGVQSQGMLLAADINGRAVILTPDDPEVPAGSKVR
jgi:methionyl-tRNA synthetase